MTENHQDRLGSSRARDPVFYARLTTTGWAVPSVNPWVNDPGPMKFKGVVGRFGVAGFIEMFPTQEIAFLAGWCSGIFYHNEVVEVVRWLFRSQPQGHEYKWIAKGRGQKSAWTRKPGQFNVITSDGARVGAGFFGPHYISEGGSLGNNPETATVFPGMAFPYAKTPGTINFHGRDVHWRWLGAEGKFAPILQAPSDDEQPEP